MASGWRRARRWILWLLLAALAVVLAVLLWWAGWIVWWKYQPVETTSFMRRDVAALQLKTPNIKLAHEWVPYDKISVHLKRAVIAAEDANFLDHEGVDWTRSELSHYVGRGESIPSIDNMDKGNGYIDHPKHEVVFVQYGTYRHDQKRPRKKFITPSTKEVLYAQYFAKWADKIERVAVANYPARARGKVFGEVIAIVAIWPNGTIDSVDVLPSGQPILDQALVRIIKLSAPFERFSAEMTSQCDLLVISARFGFIDELSGTRSRVTGHEPKAATP